MAAEREHEDLDSYVDALVDESLAVSWVILGDEEAAREATLRTLVHAHENRHDWADDRPVSQLRRETVRQALQVARQRAKAHGIPASAHPANSPGETPGDEVLPPREALSEALQGLVPVDRALLAATCLQDASPADAYAWVGDSSVQPIERSETTIRDRLDHHRVYASVEVVLREATAELSSAGLLDEAQQRMRRARLRRRLLIGGTLGALAVAAGVALKLTPDPVEHQASTGIESVPANVTLHTMPTWDAFAQLPMLPNALQDTGIPATWGFTDFAEAVPLSQLGTAEGSIRALFNLNTPDGRTLPVLHIPSHDPPFVVLDGPDLPDTTPGELVWSTRLIDDDRRRVAILTNSRVTFVEPGTGRTTPVDLPGEGVIDGGWTTGSRWFMAILSAQTLRIDPVSGEVSPVGGAAGYGRKKLDMVGSSLTLFDIDSQGVVNGGKEPPGPINGVLGPTTTNTEGWSAAGVSISNPALVGGAGTGVYALSWDVSARGALLVPAAGPSGDAITPMPGWPVGWAPGDVLLLFTPVSEGSIFILGWNVIDGSVYRVSRIVLPEGAFWAPPSLSP